MWNNNVEVSARHLDMRVTSNSGALQNNAVLMKSKQFRPAVFKKIFNPSVFAYCVHESTLNNYIETKTVVAAVYEKTAVW